MRYQLDTQQYRCPIPLLMTKKAILGLNKGDVLEVNLNTESAVEDFVLLCKTLHCSIQVDPTRLRLTICK
ncbi:sulfurtransferase TusA family protein [Conservatibacter flavescens]|uniref:Disulfide bond formation regulator protein SirA n=1 Tax=Conservatibacter flavescens TaxID=28161 RepID=A0A2M8S2V1_9PAST|nr:sulfurtransferase TusA family protein [Conservatibacter flavescens]PJG85437.1 disulfide bond formation regulator protein SirA [Conservatibacter flavescens]